MPEQRRVFRKCKTNGDSIGYAAANTTLSWPALNRLTRWFRARPGIAFTFCFAMLATGAGLMAIALSVGGCVQPGECIGARPIQECKSVMNGCQGMMTMEHIKQCEETFNINSCLGWTKAHGCSTRSQQGKPPTPSPPTPPTPTPTIPATGKVKNDPEIFYNDCTACLARRRTNSKSRRRATNYWCEYEKSCTATAAGTCITTYQDNSESTAAKLSLITRRRNIPVQCAPRDGGRRSKQQIQQGSKPKATSDKDKRGAAKSGARHLLGTGCSDDCKWEGIPFALWETLMSLSCIFLIVGIVATCKIGCCYCCYGMWGFKSNRWGVIEESSKVHPDSHVIKISKLDDETLDFLMPVPKPGEEDSLIKPKPSAQFFPGPKSPKGAFFKFGMPQIGVQPAPGQIRSGGGMYQMQKLMNGYAAQRIAYAPMSWPQQQQRAQRSPNLKPAYWMRQGGAPTMMLNPMQMQQQPLHFITPDNTAHVRCVVFVHGTGGSPTDWNAWQTKLAHDPSARAENRRTAFLKSTATARDGIQEGGKQLSDEIRAFLVREVGGRKDLIVIGHSVGGLVARYALGLLGESGILDDLHLDTFFTLCAPHLGIATPGAQKQDPNTAGRSELQLAFEDSDGKAHDNSDVPILAEMARPGAAYYDALSRFDRRIVAGMTRNDIMVPISSAIINTGCEPEQVDMIPVWKMGSTKDTTGANTPGRATTYDSPEPRGEASGWIDDAQGECSLPATPLSQLSKLSWKRLPVTVASNDWTADESASANAAHRFLLAASQSAETTPLAMDCLCTMTNLIAMQPQSPTVASPTVASPTVASPTVASPTVPSPTVPSLGFQVPQVILDGSPSDKPRLMEEAIMITCSAAMSAGNECGLSTTQLKPIVTVAQFLLREEKKLNNNLTNHGDVMRSRNRINATLRRMQRIDFANDPESAALSVREFGTRTLGEPVIQKVMDPELSGLFDQLKTVLKGKAATDKEIEEVEQFELVTGDAVLEDNKNKISLSSSHANSTTPTEECECAEGPGRVLIDMVKENIRATIDKAQSMTTKEIIAFVAKKIIKWVLPGWVFLPVLLHKMFKEYGNEDASMEDKIVVTVDVLVCLAKTGLSLIPGGPIVTCVSIIITTGQYLMHAIHENPEYVEQTLAKMKKLVCSFQRACFYKKLRALSEEVLGDLGIQSLVNVDTGSAVTRIKKKLRSLGGTAEDAQNVDTLAIHSGEYAIMESTESLKELYDSIESMRTKGDMQKQLVEVWSKVNDGGAMFMQNSTPLTDDSNVEDLPDDNALESAHQKQVVEIDSTLVSIKLMLAARGAPPEFTRLANALEDADYELMQPAHARDVHAQLSNVLRESVSYKALVPVACAVFGSARTSMIVSKRDDFTDKLESTLGALGPDFYDKFREMLDSAKSMLTSANAHPAYMKLVREMEEALRTLHDFGPLKAKISGILAQRAELTHKSLVPIAEAMLGEESVSDMMSNIDDFIRHATDTAEDVYDKLKDLAAQLTISDGPTQECYDLLQEALTSLDLMLQARVAPTEYNQLVRAMQAFKYSEFAELSKEELEVLYSQINAVLTEPISRRSVMPIANCILNLDSINDITITNASKFRSASEAAVTEMYGKLKTIAQRVEQAGLDESSSELMQEVLSVDYRVFSNAALNGLRYQVDTASQNDLHNAEHVHLLAAAVLGRYKIDEVVGASDKGTSRELKVALNDLSENIHKAPSALVEATRHAATAVVPFDSTSLATVQATLRQVQAGQMDTEELARAVTFVLKMWVDEPSMRLFREIFEDGEDVNPAVLQQTAASVLPAALAKEEQTQAAEAASLLSPNPEEAAAALAAAESQAAQEAALAASRESEAVTAKQAEVIAQAQESLMGLLSDLQSQVPELYINLLRTAGDDVLEKRDLTAVQQLNDGISEIKAEGDETQKGKLLIKVATRILGPDKAMEALG